MFVYRYEFSELKEITQSRKTDIKYHLTVVRCHFLGILKFSGVLFGPDDLWESSEDITNDISFLSSGDKKNAFVLVLYR